ncbi:MAG: hypothetical protein PHU71_05655 [Candidatus Gracilibacteria bacterium]|nr:hypothetical protein [Candidatus Gracilibacteria bacterium]
MQKSKTIILTLVLLVLSACTQNQSDGIAPAVTQNTPSTERKEHHTFSIDMPADWREVEYGTQMIYLPEGSEAVDPLSEKVAVIVSFLPENNTLSLAEIMDAGIQDTKKLMPDLEINSTENNYAFGKIDDGIKLEMTSTIQNQTVSYTQINGMAFNRVYALVHSCIKGKCKYTDTYYDMVTSFMETGEGIQE